MLRDSLGTAALQRRITLLEFFANGRLAGTPYRRAEFSWVLEDNRDINQAAEFAGAVRYKTYRVYQKAL